MYDSKHQFLNPHFLGFYDYLDVEGPRIGINSTGTRYNKIILFILRTEGLG